MYNSFQEAAETIAQQFLGTNKTTVCKKIEAALRADTGDKIWRCDLLRSDHLSEFVNASYVTMQTAIMRVCFPKTLIVLRHYKTEAPNENPTTLLSLRNDE